MSELVKLDAEIGIPALVSMVEAKLKDLKEIETTVYKVSGGRIEGFANKISEETEIENLLRMGSVILARSKAYDDFAAHIERESYPNFNGGGGTLEDYVHDIKLRIRWIEQKETLETLKGFKEDAIKLMSEADQKSILISKMSSYFSKK